MSNRLPLWYFPEADRLNMLGRIDSDGARNIAILCSLQTYNDTQDTLGRVAYDRIATEGLVEILSSLNLDHAAFSELYSDQVVNTYWSSQNTSLKGLKPVADPVFTPSIDLSRADPSLGDYYHETTGVIWIFVQPDEPTADQRRNYIRRHLIPTAAYNIIRYANNTRTHEQDGHEIHKYNRDYTHNLLQLTKVAGNIFAQYTRQPLFNV